MVTRAVVLFSLLASSGCVYYDDQGQRTERSAWAPGPVDFVRVAIASGDVTVRGSSRRDVDVLAGLFSPDGSDDDHHDDDWDDDDTELALVPSGRGLELRLYRGDSHAEIEWVTVSLSEDAELDLSTGSGDIVAAGMHGLVRASSGSGDITVATAGEVDLGTSAGDVDAVASEGRVDSSSGDVTVTALDGAPGRTLRIHSGSGDVRVVVPAGIGIDLDASTGAGDIRITAGDVDIEETGSVQTVIGDGELRLRIDTDAGDVIVQD